MSVEPIHYNGYGRVWSTPGESVVVKDLHEARRMQQRLEFQRLNAKHCRIVRQYHQPFKKLSLNLKLRRNRI